MPLQIPHAPTCGCGREYRRRSAAAGRPLSRMRGEYSRETGVANICAKNRRAVLRIFDRYGWVTNSLAGKDAAHNFWLLVQHQTPEIQQRFLPALEKAAKGNNASMSDYAYLYDRVQMGLNKPQRWGTQATCENGKPVLYPVEDPAGLDKRRAELFMPPIREYLQLDPLVKSCAQAGK